MSTLRSGKQNHSKVTSLGAILHAASFSVPPRQARRVKAATGPPNPSTPLPDPTQHIIPSLSFARPLTKALQVPKCFAVGRFGECANTLACCGLVNGRARLPIGSSCLNSQTEAQPSPVTCDDAQIAWSHRYVYFFLS